jgi:hypothetical protein
MANYKWQHGKRTGTGRYPMPLRLPVRVGADLMNYKINFHPPKVCGRGWDNGSPTHTI